MYYLDIHKLRFSSIPKILSADVRQVSFKGNNFSEALAWCDEVMPDKYVYPSNSCGMLTDFSIIEFVDIESMILFALKWL